MSASKRLLDLLAASALLVVTAVPMAIIAVLIRMTSKGPAIYWSQRVGRNNWIFLMPKFRTMRTDTPNVATHLLSNAEQWMTPVGRLLRSTSVDELPQLWSICVGDMSLVGPRPALFNQYDLIELRTQRGVHRVRPGLTGWAQINGRDDLPIPTKVALDAEYLAKGSLIFDLRVLLLTVVKVLRREGVCHGAARSRRSSAVEPRATVDNEPNACSAPGQVIQPQ